MYPIPSAPLSFFTGLYEREPVFRKYWLFVQYISASPSYLQTLTLMRKRNWKPQTEDQLALLEVATDFGDISVVDHTTWWNRTGTGLFGFEIKGPQIRYLGTTKSDEVFEVEYSNYEHFVFSIPTSLTISQAIAQLKQHANKFRQKMDSKLQTSAKYTLLNSRLQVKTLEKGLKALELYRQGRKVWQIGNDLQLVPSMCFDETSKEAQIRGAMHDKKNSLAAAARRLITHSVLVSENAARGRFPSADKFDGIDFGDYLRK